MLRVKAEADDIKTPPGAPTNLAVIANGAGKAVTYNSTTQQYVGNDPTPQVTGDTMAEQAYRGLRHCRCSHHQARRGHEQLRRQVLYRPRDGPGRRDHSFTAKVKNANGLVSAASAAVTYLLDTVQPRRLITQARGPGRATFASVGSAKPDFTATPPTAGQRRQAGRVPVLPSSGHALVADRLDRHRARPGHHHLRGRLAYHGAARYTGLADGKYCSGSSSPTTRATSASRHRGRDGGYDQTHSDASPRRLPTPARISTPRTRNPTSPPRPPIPPPRPTGEWHRLGAVLLRGLD